MLIDKTHQGPNTKTGTDLLQSTLWGMHGYGDARNRQERKCGISSMQRSNGQDV
jgi:hypothetical protein